MTDGGFIRPLLLNAGVTKNLSLFNPSILEVEKDSKYLVNLRWCNYYLHHCESSQKYPTPWGPLNYVREDDDPHLRTENFICDLDLNSFNVVNERMLNDSLFPKLPEWDFVGLEDIRLANWEGSLYVCGVRRFAPDGKGRIQLSKVKLTKENALETERCFLDPISDSYCEKNWAPILNEPFNFVSWISPLQVLEYSPKFKNRHYRPSIKIKRDKHDISGTQPRGGSQILTYKDFYICLGHETHLKSNKVGQRDASYFHRFFVWDRDWNLIKYSAPFKFLGGLVEFSCGIVNYQDSFLITFGYQDNGAYIFKMPHIFFDKFLKL